MNAQAAGDPQDSGFGPVEFRVDRSVPGVFVVRVFEDEPSALIWLRHGNQDAPHHGGE